MPNTLRKIRRFRATPARIILTTGSCRPELDPPRPLARVANHGTLTTQSLRQVQREFSQVATVPACAPGAFRMPGTPPSHAAFLLSHLRLRPCQWSESVPEVTLMILGNRPGSRFIQRLHWIASDLIEGLPARHILQTVWVTICGEGNPVALHAGC
jgi:hypothetical protein